MGRISEARKQAIMSAYFEQELEPGEIAAQMGISQRTVMGLLSDAKMLEPYRRRSEAAKLRAQICVNESAEEAARKQAELMRAGEASESVTQRAAKDILDRAGVRVAKEDSREIRITFTHGMPRLGMPGRGGEAG